MEHKKLKEKVEQHSVEDSKTEKELLCSICFSALNTQNLAIVQLCNHEFCFGCISTWAKTKLTCPLCKAPFDSVMHQVNESHEEIVFETPTKQLVDESSPDLSCLDSTYFLEEVRRLLRQSEFLGRKYFSDPSKLKEWSSQKFNMLKEVNRRLYFYQEIFKDYEAINNQEDLLNDLYSLAEELKFIGSERFTPNIITTPQVTPKRYGANDYYSDNEYSDEDDYEDYYYSNSHKKKNQRKQNGRVQKKKYH
eukprot:TRINITY_DN431_c0_g1_i1.p1 TRINITY_DN431_c0_g1~~TRINITY_DN431_c0_g1_i1.p1  ORF type:complete len:250 (-),score=27.28 TRINITY_DN431_c0_g1_i1:79-828(-)